MKRLALCASLSLAASAAASAQADPQARIREGRAWMTFVTSSEREPFGFLEEHVAASLLERAGEDALLERLGAFLDELDGATFHELFTDGPNQCGVVFAIPGGDPLTTFVRVEDAAPHAIEDLWFEGGMRLDPDAAVEELPPSLTWENLDERMAMEVEAGFSGVLLLTRDGEVVVDQGYGMANREKGIACTPETIFAIGSTPIDFTKAGILLLAQDGALDLDDPITKYFDGVPDDKLAITLRHLMTGASGLQDFHDEPGDRDPDHGWIDRDEAVRRILGKSLLFAPGTGNAHSHSAWGLLAAVIEIVGETSYQDFTRTRMFAPAGMTSTGFHGDPVPEERLAIGYGERSDGEVNAPPYWGTTSWLVMGSGGMISTARDLLRWQQALRANAFLTPERTTLYWNGEGLLTGGNVYGFAVCLVERESPQFVVISNSIEGSTGRRFERLASELSQLR